MNPILIAVLFFALVAYSLDNGCVDITDTYVPEPSTTCSSQGYCVYGTEDVDLVGCSCFSGYSGASCAAEDTVRDTCITAKRQSATSSNFATTVGGSIVDGKIQLTITAPVEKTHLDDANNFATYTTLRFKDQDQCDYPEGVDTVWAKEFNGAECEETYEGTTDTGDLIGCMDAAPKCYDSNDAVVAGCAAALCTAPPCKRCYSGQVLATRGYVKTSLSGELSATATAENCHYFTICLPWINTVQSSIQVTKIPDFETSFIVTRVAFSCFETLFDDCVENADNSWLVQLEAAAMYPWYVQRTEGASAGLKLGDALFPLVNIQDVSNCHADAAVGELCIQKLTFQVPGCDSLEIEAVYDLVGLEYNCVGDCAAARDKLIADDLLFVDASVTLQATQENCGADFEIDGTDTVTMDFDAYSSNAFTELNAVFVEGDASVGTAYFKILADSTPHVTGMSLVSLTSTVNGDTNVLASGASGYTFDSCPAKAGEYSPLCFHIPVENLYDAGTLDDNALITVTLTAVVELNYEGGAKRQVGLGSSFDLTNNVRIVPSSQEETTGSAAALAFSSLAV